MRHRIRKAKLGRTTEHRTAMLSNLVCSLIKYRSVKTTLAKAKAARVVAEKMVTLGKKGQSEESEKGQYRRLVSARLRQSPRRHFVGQPDIEGRKTPRISGSQKREQWQKNEDVVRILFEDIAPEFEGRNGGYTRVIKLGRRRGDAAEMAILEWVKEGDSPVKEDKPAKQKAAKQTESEKESKVKSEEKTEVAADIKESADPSSEGSSTVETEKLSEEAEAQETSSSEQSESESSEKKPE